MSTAPQILDSPPKPQKRRYDQRKYNGRTKSVNKTGRKPIWQKHLARNTAAKLFSELNIKEICMELLASKDARLRFQVVCYLWDRLEGKPFTAINPAEVKQPGTIINDNRLQVAMQTLLPAGEAKKTRKRKAVSEPVSEPAQLESGSGIEAQAAAQIDDPSSQKPPPHE